MFRRMQARAPRSRDAILLMLNEKSEMRRPKKKAREGVPAPGLSFNDV
jgi:hypothetical protein